MKSQEAIQHDRGDSDWLQKKTTFPTSKQMKGECVSGWCRTTDAISNALTDEQ